MSVRDIDLAAQPAGRRPHAGSHRLTETRNFGSNPGELRMLSYAPADVAPGAPLVVVLHGCTQSALEYAAGAGWLQLADVYGFVVLAPEQSQGNNPNRCFNWFQPADSNRDQGEAASIRQMIAVALAAHSCDPSRVFVTGLSAGGAMTAALLADYPEVFAAGGVIAGLPYRAADNMMEAFGAMFQGRSQSPRRWGDLVRGGHGHDGAWPRVSIWQGDADKTVKPSNAEALVQQWTDVHGLAAGPTRSTVSGTHRRDVWLSAAGEPLVELNTVAGLGHGAPLAVRAGDGWGAAGPFLLEAGVASSLELLQFWGVADQAPAQPASAAPEPPPQPVQHDPMEVMAALAAQASRAAGNHPAVDLQGLMHKAMNLARRLR